MAYERVQKSFGQSSNKKKHTPIVPPLIDHPTQADSQLSPKVKLSRIPSKEEREAIKRKIFGQMTEEDRIQAQTQTSPQSTLKSSHKVNISALPSKEKRDAIKRKLFGNLTETNEFQCKTPESSSVVGTGIQAKLTIGAPEDKYEQEADRVAAQVVNQINAPVAQQKSQNLQREDMSEEDELMMKSDTSRIQREAIPEEEEKLQMKPMLQLQAGVGSVAAPAELESSIQQARSGGQTLADNVRQPMEQAFGADFSGVKVHTDTQADQLNQSIQARAFATGQDVFFRQGEYNPSSREGQELIAHELTHVVQQSGKAVNRTMLSSIYTTPHKSTTTIAQLKRGDEQYAPSTAIKAMKAKFRDDHVPQNFDKETAIDIAGNRGYKIQTIISIEPEEALKEIVQALKDSTLQVTEVENIEFETKNEYPTIEVRMNQETGNYAYEASVSRLKLTMGWTNNDGFQLYHFNGKV